MKKIFSLLIIASILIAFSTLIFASGTIGVKDYIKDKFPLLFNFYLSSLEDLDSHEKEFIDLLLNLSKEEQQYYAKKVYEHGFSMALLEEVIESYTYVNLGAAYRSAGEYTKAIEAYQQALQMDPDNPASYTNLGAAYRLAGEYTKAIEAYQQALQKALQKDPDNPARYYTNLGVAYRLAGEYTKAIEAYQQALQMDPDLSLIHI